MKEDAPQQTACIGLCRNEFYGNKSGRELCLVCRVVKFEGEGQISLTGVYGWSRRDSSKVLNVDL